MVDDYAEMTTDSTDPADASSELYPDDQDLNDESTPQQTARYLMAIGAILTPFISFFVLGYTGENDYAEQLMFGKDVGAHCTEAADCWEGECVILGDPMLGRIAPEDGVCALHCNQNHECPGDKTCVPVDSEHFCVTPDFADNVKQRQIQQKMQQMQQKLQKNLQNMQPSQ